MLTGHIQLMPLSQAPECLSSTFVFEITTLCNFMLHNQLLREGFIQWHWLSFLSQYFLSFPLFSSLHCPAIVVDETVGEIAIWFCPVLITDCTVILPFFFSSFFLSEERFIPQKIISQLSHKSKRLYYTFGEITLRRQTILHLPFPRLENKTLRDW